MRDFTQMYDVPSRDRICRAFASMAAFTWDAIRDFRAIGEDSLTDVHILHLKRRCPEEVRVIKFSRNKEAVNGADWEWWFGSSHHWFGMRVQAKKLDPSSMSYAHLDHRVRKSRDLQVDRLIADANERNLYPMYCFYNFWDRDEREQEWRCGTFAPNAQLWGATVADASKVRTEILKGNKSLSEIGPIAMPLNCLACCRGHARRGGSAPDPSNPGLPHRSRGIAVVLNGDPNGVPPIVPHLPQYLGALLDAQTADINPPSLDLDGILIVEENPDVYNTAYGEQERPMK